MNVQFDLVTIQGWGKGAVISHADNIHFITPHLEGDDSLFDVIKGSRAFAAESGLAWTNACQGGKAKSGYCFFVDSSSNASFRDFTICCTPDQIVKAESGAKVVLSNNSAWSVPAKADDVTAGESTIIKGRGAASGGCAPGQLYMNISGGPGNTLYVCEGGIWKSK